MPRDSTVRIGTSWGAARLRSVSSRCACGGRCGGSGGSPAGGGGRAAKRSRVSSDSTTEVRWPILKERAPFVQASTPHPGRRRARRSTWLLTGLAFLCGGLVSAAGFSIGWRHQAQRDTAARSALAAETARTHRLSAQLATARANAARERLAAARAAAAVRRTSQAAAALAAEVTASSHAAEAVSSGAGGVGSSTVRVTHELQTLLTYLTTTPSAQIDSGYIASQASYLTRQLDALHAAGGSVSTAATRFETAMHKLGRDAAALRR
jgi:hypothetical protein